MLQNDMHSRLMVRLFVGCKLTSEIAMYLKESRAWQQALIAPAEERELVVTHFEQSDYLGRFIQGDLHSLNELKKIEESLKESISRYCPKLNLDKLSLCIFPQTFIP